MTSEPETAVWAAQRGLLLLPTQLEPDGGVAPETMELYRRLRAKLSHKELAGNAK